VGGLLTGSGSDGVKGLQLLIEARARGFIQSPVEYAPRDRYDAVRALGLEVDELKQDAIGGWILDRTRAA
jgi:two-component system chemotaxis response regulator CheB